ncbi:MAG: Lrp/AsnC family transcriptional regulator [Cyanobacteria bacterium P01_H01_bin.121]
MDLDTVDRQLLTALQQDARLSYAELGRYVGLSSPAVAERIHRLEERGIIIGYRAIINPVAVGLKIRVFIDLTTAPQNYPLILNCLREIPAVQRCHHLTGQTSLRIEALIAEIADLEPLLATLSQYGQTVTAIVLSSPFENTLLLPHGSPGAGDKGKP